MSDVIVNWDEAPEGATHYGWNKYGSDWYNYDADRGFGYQWRFFNTHTVTWDLIKGKAPVHKNIISRPASEQPKWAPGKDLPPVGTTVALTFDSKAENSSLYKIDCKAGDEVEIIAHFTNKLGVHLAAYVSYADGVGFVKQGIAQVFKAVPTPEEKAKEVRRNTVNQILDDLGYTAHGEARDVIKDLYDKGYLWK